MALEDYRGTMVRCTRCSYCKWIPFAQVKSWRFAKGCPTIEYNKFQAYSGGGQLIAALSLLEGRSTYTDKLKDIVWRCQICGECDVACKVCRYDMDVIDTLREFRFRMVDEGQLLPQFKPVIDCLNKEDNMMMKPKAGRGKWADGLGLKDLTKEKAQVVFHAGCSYSFDPGLQKIARTAATLLKKAGVDVGIMGASEICSGARAYDMGYRDELLRCAKSNIAAWTKAGVKTVVTPCSDCYYAFKRVYPKEAGSKFEVLHTVEYVDRLIKEGKIKFRKTVPLTVTYHDPCHLGRQGEPYVPWNGKTTKIFGQITKHIPPKPRYIGAWGIYQPPRDILTAIPGVELVEMERIKEFAWCCGAGGGVNIAYPDFNEWTSWERVEEAKATGAEALVTACPWCERNFLDTVKKNGEKIKVYDVLELVQQAI